MNRNDRVKIEEKNKELKCYTKIHKNEDINLNG